MNDLDEFSSFEIEESIIGDPTAPNDSLDTSDVKTTTNVASTSAREHKNNKTSNLNQSTKDYRSPLSDSTENLTSESDAIVLSSDDEDNSLDSEADKPNQELESSSSSSDEESNYIEVTKDVYNAHVAKIKTISERILQYDNLLRLSSNLPDKGLKLKQLVVNLNSELDNLKTTLPNLKIKAPSVLELDFQNLSITENQSEKEDSASELSYEYVDSIAKLFEGIKRSEKSMPSKSDIADQPRLINGELMPHQRHALAWMIWRENQFPIGGILGDDMGLGKTLTMISLIARHIEMRESKSLEKGNKKPLQEASGERVLSKTARSSSSWKIIVACVDRFYFSSIFVDCNGRTLVVCPASVIRQWEDEINKFTNFAISVCLHHGDKRSVSAKELTLHEVVITTYGIVRTEIEKVDDFMLNILVVSL